MKNHHKDIIAISAAWMTENPDAKNIDVPVELLNKWLHLIDDGHDDSREIIAAVFLFGFLQQENAQLHALGLDSSAIIFESLSECFTRWKLKLLMARLYHASDPQGIPMVLFKFNESDAERDLVRDWSSN